MYSPELVSNDPRNLSLMANLQASEVGHLVVRLNVELQQDPRPFVMPPRRCSLAEWDTSAGVVTDRVRFILGRGNSFLVWEPNPCFSLSQGPTAVGDRGRFAVLSFCA